MYAGVYEADVVNKMYLFDSAKRQWTEGPAMPTARADHGCDMAEDSGGKRKMVVMGGFGPNDNSDNVELDSVDIYDVDSGIWATGMTHNLCHQSLCFVWSSYHLL